MHSSPKALPKNVYRISWAIIFAQLVFAISAFAADGSSHEEWPLYVWPLGIWPGWRFANRSLPWRRFHFACLITGIAVTPIFVSQAVRYYQLYAAIKGSGFLAGLGEIVTAAIYFFLGVGTFCLFTAGAATTYNGWRFSLRTLLIVTTIVAAILGVFVATIN